MQTTPPARKFLRLALTALVMLAIFAADTGTEHEIAAAVFYALVLLTSARALARRGILTLSALCIALTIASFMATPHNGPAVAGIINTAISLAAIVMTAWLILKIQAAQTAAHAAQAQLLRLARIRSLDSLTTSIAHEINQPLTAIVTSGNACQRWLQRAPPNLDKAAAALERILAAAGRASRIIVRVRSLSRGGSTEKTAFDLNRTLMDVITLSQDEIRRHGITLSLELAPGLPPALADPVQIQQITGNLLLNAMEAMSAAPGRVHRLHVTSRVRDGMIVCSVQDTGTGIPAALAGRVFDAFWSTKPDGTGLGLSLSRTLIEANGGQIWLEPAPMGGTAFHFSVPVAPT